VLCNYYTMWSKSADRTTPSFAEPIPPPPVRTPPPSPKVTLIGKTVEIRGQIYAEEELTIDGALEGSIEVRHRLTVGPTGKVKATVKAREVVVAGSIDGNVEASDRISIQHGARIVGDLKTASIVIDDGAYFKGGIDILRPAVEKPEVPLVAKPATA
jgi:cytoskeletal protein CcmA (bactofilin family)